MLQKYYINIANCCIFNYFIFAKNKLKCIIAINEYNKNKLENGRRTTYQKTKID
jgi:hypothetical protein